MPELALDPTPGALSATEMRLAKESSAALGKIAWTPALPIDLLIASGERIPLPSSVGTLLQVALKQMSEGHVVQLLPVRPRSPGLEHWDVSEAEADQLQELLDSQAGTVGRLRGEPKAIALGDPSLLR